MTGRSTSQGVAARLGFQDTGRARSLAEAEEFDGLVDENDSTGLLRSLARSADPDAALLGLLRLLEAAGADRDSDLEGLRTVCRTDGAERNRLAAVLGASVALGDHLARHPAQWPAATSPEILTAEQRVDALVRAVREPDRGDLSGPDALRVAYRRHLLSIAAVDLVATDPSTTLETTAEALADLAAAALEAALALACADHPEDADRARLSVIGMGKCGGRELNYISDVDVIFVAEPATEDVSEGEAMAAGTRLATSLMKICSASTGEGSLWQVDAALRPEGKQGPLVRTVASHEAYYRRWAKTWEFQALLKARVVAGDREIGQAYLDVVTPLVWDVASRDHFVEDVQKMRMRVEEHLPKAEASREIKLGVGGLRDIEFSAQLLQLVHGRTDESIRSPRTLDALDQLVAGGYVGREDAVQLSDAYRFLRSLEHRIQVFKMRRTHLMPTAETDLRRLGRSMGLREDPEKQVIAQWKEEGREVRRIHESLFYRPLLAAVARLSSTDATLTPAAARDRLAALGYRDPRGALRHLEALTSGTSRTASIQKTLLPVMLGWFADEADPDAGLLAFRKVSEELGRTPWYLKMLRDEGRAADRLAHVLARSRYAADLLAKEPEAVRILGEQAGLRPRARDEIHRTMTQGVGRAEDAETALTAARVIRRRELFRIALADLVGELDLVHVGYALTDLAEAMLEVALYIAVRKVEDSRGPVKADIALIGMGRFGGREMGYGSDADLVVVHRPHAGAEDVGQVVFAVAQELQKLLRSSGPDPNLEVDLDLRPEGKNGPLSRTVDGYRTYYERWAEPWEHHALIRARPVAGDASLGAEFIEVADRYRYPKAGLSTSARKEIRRLKARMESERLPRGADPKTHLKLGRGGLSDVEWSVQILQLEHAHAVPDLRTTETLAALHAATAASLISANDAAALEQAWTCVSDLRNAAVLWRSRGVESLPGNYRDAEAMHRIVGGGPGGGVELGEKYRRATRRARTVTEQVFYGHEAG